MSEAMCKIHIITSLTDSHPYPVFLYPSIVLYQTDVSINIVKICVIITMLLKTNIQKDKCQIRILDKYTLSMPLKQSPPLSREIYLTAEFIAN